MAGTEISDGLRSAPATLWPAVLLLPAGWAVVALLNPSDFSYLRQWIVFGAVFGTLIGQTLLSAGWTIFGPGSLSARLMVTVGWLSALVAAAAISAYSYDHPADFQFAVVSAAGLQLGLWLLALLPLWLLRVATGVRLRHRDRIATVTEPPGRFRIWELLIAMLATAVFMALARTAVLSSLANEGVAIQLAILAGTGFLLLVLSLPLMLSILLDWHALAMTFAAAALNLAVPQVLVLVAVLTIGREALASVHAFWLHGFVLAWIVTITGLLRLSGYQLLAPPK